VFIFGAHHECGLYYKAREKMFGNQLEMEKMFKLNNKRKIVLAVAVLALVLIVALPYAASAAPVNDPVQGTANLLGKGIVWERVNGENFTAPASFNLTLEKSAAPSTTSAASAVPTAVPRFNVVGGKLDVNGTIYTMTSGNGAVLRARHAVLLQAQGTSATGQSVTLKLEGRYFWMGGRLFVLRMVGSVQTASGKELLLIRAEIRL